MCNLIEQDTIREKALDASRAGISHKKVEAHFAKRRAEAPREVR
jgi:hypothetical protein